MQCSDKQQEGQRPGLCPSCCLSLHCMYHCTVLIGQRLCSLSATGNHFAAFEAKPVDATYYEEDEQRELENWDVGDQIQYRDARPGGEDRTQCWIGVDTS